MKRLRVLQYCLAGALMISAVATASAAATAPEIGRCVKLAKANGEFTSSTCTVKETGTKIGKGPYEWEAGVAGPTKTFTDKAGIAKLETIHKSRVECKENLSEGEYTGPKTVGHMSVKFTGCEFKAIKKPCTSAGAKSGEIVMNTLAGELQWENKATKKVAEELFPEAGGPGAEFVTFVCGPGTSHVKGAVLVNVLAGKMLTAFTLKFTATGGKQKPEKYDQGEAGETAAFLESDLVGPYEQAGQTETVTQTNPEALEVNWLV